MNEQELIEGIVSAFGMQQLADVCGGGEVLGYFALGHLPRLAALKAFARAVDDYEGESLRYAYYHRGELPLIRHAWARFLSTSEAEFSSWMLVESTEDAPGAIPVTKVDVA